MKKILLLLLLIMAGCSPKIVHDENKAVLNANDTLKELYFNKDYKAAYEKLDEGIKSFYTPEYLKSEIAGKLEAGYGKLKKLKAVAYTDVPGRKLLTLYYEGMHDRGVSYHQVVLKGDEKGYKVYGIFVTYEPISENKGLKSIKESITIQN